MALTVVAICRVPPEGREAFEAYEAAVLAWAPVERRLVSADGATEVHVLRFEDARAFEAFLADPERARHRPLLEASGASVEVLTDVTDAAVAAPPPDPPVTARVLPADDTAWRPSNQLGVSNADLAGQLGGGPIGARFWRLAPGQASTRHRHHEQTELYVVLEGTGRLRIGDELHTLAPRSAALVPAGQVRQVFNDTPEDALWLVAGAPPEAANTLEMPAEWLAWMYPDGPLAQPPELGAGSPELFVDLGSPYAWLAVERFERVVGVRPVLQPVLLGGIFGATGRSSWGRTDAREEGMAGIARRAVAAGLPQPVWPDGWPGDYLPADRAAVWANRHGRRDAFVRRALSVAFTTGADLSRVDALRAVAVDVGLDPDALEAGIASAAVKAELRSATDRALRLGVTGVPTTRLGDTLWWGDDRLEDVARHLA